MKKTTSESSSKKRLKSLCKESFLDLTRLELDKIGDKALEMEQQKQKQKLERNKLLSEVKKLLEGFSS